MREMSFQEFQALSDKEPFLFFFTLENYGCGLCKIQEKEYLKHDIPNLIKVNADTEEQLMELGIQVLPCTIKFKDGDILQKYGVQYEKQIREMLNG